MKIALIRREFITHLDGVNRFIAALAEGLSLLGHKVVIISWSYRGVQRENLEEWFKRVHGLETDIEIYTLRGPENRDRWTVMLYEWYTKGSALIKELGADVALVNGVVSLRFEPKIAIAHGPIHISPFQKFILTILYRLYDHVVCVSKASQVEYKGIVKCNSIIPLPLIYRNYKSKPLDERDDIIVHVGSRPTKNPQVSVEAVRILRMRGFNVRLVLVGEKNEAVERLAREHSFVETLYGVDEGIKAEILSRAKALVLPSSGETFSYTVLEAMASGTPPVASAAVPEDVVIDGLNGLRVNSQNPVDYANALEKLLRNEELWLKLHKAGTEFAKQFDHVNIAKRYEELVKGLLNECQRA